MKIKEKWFEFSEVTTYVTSGDSFEFYSILIANTLNYGLEADHLATALP